MGYNSVADIIGLPSFV